MAIRVAAFIFLLLRAADSVEPEPEECSETGEGCRASGRSLLQTRRHLPQVVLGQEAPTEDIEEDKPKREASSRTQRYPLALSLAKSFWTPGSGAAAGGPHAAYRRWAEQAARRLHPALIERQPRGFFVQHFMASLVAADRLGDGDGCLTADEHPEHDSFLEVLGEVAGGRVCLKDAHRLVGSRRFNESVEAAKKAHRGVLLAGMKAKDKFCFKVTASILELEGRLKSVKELQQQLVVKRSANRTLDVDEEDVRSALDGLRGALGGLYADDLRCRSCAEMKDGEGPGDTELCLEEFLEDKGLLVDGGSAGAASPGSLAEASLADLGGAAQRCVYGRADTCPLAFRDVPLLGTHNSNAYPQMTKDCSAQVLACTEWSTEAKKSCTSHRRHCASWKKRAEDTCTTWGTKCTRTAQRHCGWFGFVCGAFCAASREVCLSSRRVVTWSCDRYESACQSLMDYMAYTGCKKLDWVCDEGARAIGATRCIFENQAAGIANQLSRGARAFDLDSCLHQGELWNCHPGMMTALGAGAVHDDLVAIRDFLAANPGEVVHFRWMNMGHGVEGVDYNLSTFNDSHAYHRDARMQLIRTLFGEEFSDWTRRRRSSWGSRRRRTVSRRRAGVGWTENMTQTLKTMVEKDVRLVVQQDFQNVRIRDSWSESASTGTATSLMRHLEDFCGSRSAGDVVRLSVFSRFASRAGWFELEDDVKIPCPNGDTTETGACPTGGVQGKARSIAPLGDASLAVGAGRSDWTTGFCNAKTAEVVNKKLVESMDNLVEACHQRDVNVSSILVDYMSLEQSGLNSGISRAIDKAVAKRGVHCIRTATKTSWQLQSHTIVPVAGQVCQEYGI